MHPYLIADLAAAHAADLLREAAAHRRDVAARRPGPGPILATARRVSAALHRAMWPAPSCCPA